jgi:hypothetical protein
MCAHTYLLYLRIMSDGFLLVHSPHRYTDNGTEIHTDDCETLDASSHTDIQRKPYVALFTVAYCSVRVG